MSADLRMALSALPCAGQGLFDDGSSWSVFEGVVPLPQEPLAIGLRLEVVWSDATKSVAESVSSPLTAAAPLATLTVAHEQGHDLNFVRAATVAVFDSAAVRVEVSELSGRRRSTEPRVETSASTGHGFAVIQLSPATSPTVEVRLLDASGEMVGTPIHVGLSSHIA